MKQKKQTNDKYLIVLGVIAAIIAAVGITVGALAANGVFNSNDNSNNNDNDSPIKDPNIALKPIIYLYPEEETEVVVKLGAPDRITASYPRYVDGWNVVAHPNGDLTDKTTGNKLYALYWEGERNDLNIDKSTGFMVRGGDSAVFLEKKLDQLGLNYKEKEEFIVYWLPKLEAHNYNYIYFETLDEIERDMPLELSVEPDTLIRIRMVFEGLDEYREVKEQSLSPAPGRSGFTVVEWGGTDLTRD